MDPRNKSRRPRPPTPAKVGRRGKGASGPDGSQEGRGQAPRSEDFAERRDIETADEPAEQHDRQHHEPRRGVESSKAP
jgi:hypothetical protein